MRNTFLRCGLALSLATLLSVGCDDDDDDDGQDGSSDGSPNDGSGDGTGDGSPGLDGGLDDGGTGPTACDPATDGLELPEGFCATAFAGDLGPARHIAVTPSGDVFVARGEAEGRDRDGLVAALRDADGDGVAEEVSLFGEGGANGIFWAEGYLYVAQKDRILRYALADGTLEPSADPDILVSGLPADGDHTAKTVVVHGDKLYVNIGSASNACQVENRAVESPGVDPCLELDERAGVWTFAASQLNQTAADGERFVRGGRNLNALAIDPATDKVFGAQNGRDQLYENWPDLFTAEQDQLLPNEVVYALDEGDDYGWPYCYFDATKNASVLAPEYGGDGTEVGRCASVEAPVAVYPAHWAPLGAVFYDGANFPARYAGGLFLAHHGSRFDPQAPTDDVPGYNVTFQPFADGAATADFEEFATGFAGDGRPLPDAAEHRPVGLAVGPDGALYIGDDKGGSVWRVTYTAPDDEVDAGVGDDAGADAGADADAGAGDAGQADAATPDAG